MFPRRTLLFFLLQFGLLLLPRWAALADLTWSNPDVINGGKEEGSVHGTWGKEVNSVSTCVLVPPEAETVDIQMRYWSIDSWDSGEAARVVVNGETLWEQTRQDYTSCKATWKPKYPGGKHMCNGDWFESAYAKKPTFINHRDEQREKQDAHDKYVYPGKDGRENSVRLSKVAIADAVP